MEPQDAGAKVPQNNAVPNAQTASVTANSRPSIGFLCSNYNNGLYLRQCIDSLLNQDSPHWMLYIRDDGSTDDSQSLIQEYSDPRIVAEVDPQNRGLIQSHLRLMQLAKTKYIAILDPDDALQPGAVSHMLSEWRLHPTAAIIYSNFLLCDENLVPLCEGWSRPLKEGESNLTNQSIGHLRSFSRTAYDATTGFDLRYLYAEDFDLLYRLEEVGEVVYVNRTLYRYRQLPNSHSHHPVKKALGLLNRIESQYDAFRRRLRNPCGRANLSTYRMELLLVKGVGYAIVHLQWKQAARLAYGACKIPFLLVLRGIFS